MEESMQEEKPHKDTRLARAVLFFVTLNIFYFSPHSYREMVKSIEQGEALIEKKTEALREEAGGWISGRRFVDKSFPKKPRVQEMQKRMPPRIRRC